MLHFSINLALAIVFIALTMLCSHHIEARNVYQIWDMDEPVSEKVVRCRITCLEKFQLEDVANMAETTEACIQTANCFMCWDFCRILQQEKRIIAKSMCTNETCVSISAVFFASTGNNFKFVSYIAVGMQICMLLS